MARNSPMESHRKFIDLHVWVHWLHKVVKMYSHDHRTSRNPLAIIDGQYSNMVEMLSLLRVTWQQTSTVKGCFWSYDRYRNVSVIIIMLLLSSLKSTSRNQHVPMRSICPSNVLSGHLQSAKSSRRQMHRHPNSYRGSRDLGFLRRVSACGLSNAQFTPLHLLYYFALCLLYRLIMF